MDLSFGGQALPSVVETYSYLETEFMCESLGPGEHDTGLSKPKYLSNTHGSHKPGFVSHRPIIHCMTMVTGKLYEQAIEAPWHVSCFLTSDFIYVGVFSTTVAIGRKHI